MAAKRIDYQSLSIELEEILTELQASEVDIDQAIMLYERGMSIAKELETYLKTAENRITKLKADWHSK